MHPETTRRTLSFGLLLMATTASAAEPKNASWAELQPIPARLPAVKQKPAEPAPCQPENFIPGETAYERVKQAGEEMTLNGEQQENERVVKLPAPYALTYYAFGCASDFSYVLDISRNGKRHGLYQHVLGFEAHPSRPVLFFAQSERKNGRYQEFIGLVDLDTKRKTPLPPLPCVSGSNARFSGERLITYGEARAGKDGKTDVCLWSLDGKLQARLLADLDWMAAAGDMLLDQVGVLPKEPGTFYALHYDRFGTPSHCELRLQSLTRANQSKRIDLGVSDSQEACVSNTAKLDTASLSGR
jgi:hypothetical protein